MLLLLLRLQRQVMTSFSKSTPRESPRLGLLPLGGLVLSMAAGVLFPVLLVSGIMTDAGTGCRCIDCIVNEDEEDEKDKSFQISKLRYDIFN